MDICIINIKMDGEESNWKGILFSEACKKFIQKIGYRIEKSSVDKMDAFTISTNPEEILLPLFSKGKKNCLFEFTSQNKVSEIKIDDFEKKIQGKNEVEEGILIWGTNISKKILEYGLEKGIHCWDLKTCSFLAAKVSFQNMIREWGSIKEIKINENTSIIICLDKEASEEGYYQLHLGIFFHNPLKKVGISDLINSIESSLKEIDNFPVKLIPKEIEISIFIRCYPQEDLFDQLEQFILNFNDEHDGETVLSYNPKHIFDFYSSSWSYYLAI